MARILAFDTATATLNVALYENQQLIAHTQIEGQRQHGAILLPTIVNLLEQVGWERTSIDRIVVGRGPGSYTGLRIGVTLAKTWVFAGEIEISAVSSLALLASNLDPNFLAQKTLLVPMMDARRMTCYTGAYVYQEGQLSQVLPDCHIDWIKWQDRLMELVSKEGYQQILMVGQKLENFILQIDSKLLSLTQLVTNPITCAYLERVVIHTVSQPDLFIPHYCHQTLAEQEWQAQQTFGSEVDHEGYIDIYS